MLLLLSMSVGFVFVLCLCLVSKTVHLRMLMCALVWTVYVVCVCVCVCVCACWVNVSPVCICIIAAGACVRVQCGGRFRAAALQPAVLASVSFLCSFHLSQHHSITVSHIITASHYFPLLLFALLIPPMLLTLMPVIVKSSARTFIYSLLI